MTEPVVLSEIRGSVQIVTLNRPDRINAMNGDVYDLLDDHIRAYRANDAARCLVITGAGGNFSSGGDIGWFREMQRIYGTPERRWNFDFPPYRTLSALSKPVIAAIDGYALASGFNLAVLYCDFRIASTRATLGVPGPRRGLGIGSYPMPWQHHMSVGNILHLTLTGTPASAERALEMGLVSEVVEPEELLHRAVQLAEIIAERDPHDVGFIKDYWRKSPDLPGSARATLAQVIRSNAERTT